MQQDTQIFTKDFFIENMNADSRKIINNDSFSIFFEDQLRFLDNTVKKVFHSENTFLVDIPVLTIDPAYEDYSWYMTDITGSAKIISDDSDDIPGVSQYAKRYNNVARTLASHFKLSLSEIQAIQKFGGRVATSGLEACLMMNMNKMNKIVYLGSTEGGNLTRGWLSYAGDGTNQTVATSDVAGASANAKKWANKTGALILDDLHEAINAVQLRTSAHTLFTPNRILLPLAQYQLLKTKRLLDTQVTTVFDEFNRLYPNITIEARPILAGIKEVNSFVNSKDVMIVYDNNPFHFNQIMLEQFKPTEAQAVNLSLKTICSSKHAGVAMYYPESQVFRTGI